MRHDDYDFTNEKVFPRRPGAAAHEEEAFAYLRMSMEQEVANRTQSDSRRDTFSMRLWSIALLYDYIENPGFFAATEGSGLGTSEPCRIAGEAVVAWAGGGYAINQGRCRNFRREHASRV